MSPKHLLFNITCWQGHCIDVQTTVDPISQPFAPLVKLTEYPGLWLDQTARDILIYLFTKYNSKHHNGIRFRM